ncbi:MAG TPA: PRC-barrel domain-containing protein [Vicinamibacterales bacterium]|nr:PRC-barrel domain-containing protein [Vicinamibacterales bacterium]
MLHKFSKISGFHIHAVDGEIGHVDDFLLDESTWGLRYLVVDTSNWIGGKRVLVSPQVVSGVDLERERIDVAMTREQIKGCKSLDTADLPLDEVLPAVWVM